MLAVECYQYSHAHIGRNSFLVDVAKVLGGAIDYLCKYKQVIMRCDASLRMVAWTRR